MLEINGKEYKLNQILCVSFLNDRGNFEILSGRLYDYDSKNIWLDHSYDFWDLSDTTKIEKNKIKFIQRTDNDFWR